MEINVKVVLQRFKTEVQHFLEGNGKVSSLSL
jgi:hypothetical protein